MKMVYCPVSIVILCFGVLLQFLFHSFATVMVSVLLVFMSGEFVLSCLSRVID